MAAPAIAALRRKTPKVKVNYSSGTQRPVITTLTVVAGIGLLRTFLLDEEDKPPRSYWVNLAILGFFLSLITELQPKFGKNMAYLVMTAVIFSNSDEIFTKLAGQQKKQPKKSRGTETEPAGFAATAPNDVTLYVSPSPNIGVEMRDNRSGRSRARRPKPRIAAA